MCVSNIKDDCCVKSLLVFTVGTVNVVYEVLCFDIFIVGSIQTTTHDIIKPIGKQLSMHNHNDAII